MEKQKAKTDTETDRPTELMKERLKDVKPLAKHLSEKIYAQAEKSELYEERTGIDSGIDLTTSEAFHVLNVLQFVENLEM